MADVHNPAIRSKNMRAIGSQNTQIEQRLARLLTLLELDFHTQDTTLAGRPDFVIVQYRCVIFTHGCFWHRHHCALFKIPATRTDFWLKKISNNVVRDKQNIARLRSEGWRVLVVWECALRTRHKLSDQALCERLDEWICAGSDYMELDSGGLHILDNPC